MKESTLLLLIVGFLALATGVPASASSPTYVAADSTVNNIGTRFSTVWIYDSPEDVFSNAQVTGRKWWHTNARNAADETGAPVSALALGLESTLAFDILQADHLVASDPPAYEWSFGDVPEGSAAEAWVDSLHDPDLVPVTFTPGFDASRSADKTEFTGPDTQTLTITLTPRETTEGLNVLIQAGENDVVSPVITSPIAGEGISLGREGHSLHINPTALQLNETWTVTVTIQVTPKASKVEFMPYVVIEWEGKATASGSASGGSLSRPLGDPSDEAGTWTWSAEGTYEWHWEERISREVRWSHTSRVLEGVIFPTGEAGNRVRVDFLNRWYHEVDGDSFTNAEVTGTQDWRISDILNPPDETGSPITGLRITLESDLAFDRVRQGWYLARPGDLTRMGPPVYEWSYDDVPEGPHPGVAYDAYVGFNRRTSTKLAPGFDVSRSFDRTVFTAPGTQTMTVTVTPRDEWVEKISIHLDSLEDDLVDAVIISITGWEGAIISGGGENAEINGIPMELNTPVSVTITTRVTPKVPRVEYKPIVNVFPEGRPPELSSGTTRGGSFSYTNEAGTWTVSAEGDYVWHWIARSDLTITLVLDGRSEQMTADQEPTPGPRPIPGQAVSWQVILGIVGAVVIAGAATYFLVRRRLTRRRAPL